MSSAIGVDVGTTNVKVTLVRDDGLVVAGAARQLLTERSDGRVEQDAELLWRAVVEAISEVVAIAPSVTDEVVAIGVCSQYSSTIAVAADAMPVAPAILWSDARGTDRCAALMAAHEDAFFTWIDRHGIPPIGSGLSLGHILHLQHDRPDVHQRAAAYLEPMDYVNARLTGNIAATQVTMLTTQLCDNRAVGSTTYDPLLVEMAGVDTSRLPPLLPLDAVVGLLLPSVAAETGLPETAKVYVGVTDTHAGAVATGVFTAGRGGLAIGTTSVLLDTVAAKAEDLEHEVLSMPGPFEDSYLVWAENGVGGQALSHVLGELIHADDVLGSHSIDDPFAHLDAALEATAPGAGGVLFLPWLTGSMSPSANSSMRGAFLNLSLQSTRTDLVRAAAEGVAHNVAWLLPHVEAFTSQTMEAITFVGGAARSPAWCQILADVLDRPVRPAADPDRAVSRAAGLLALQRHGVLDRSDLDNLVVTVAEHVPDRANRDVHARLQHQFEAAHSALAPLCHAPGD